MPRRADEALPLLRWRLKKSVPFDVDETVVSWMRQTGRAGALEVVTAVARQRIIKEYEELLQPLGASAGVVLSSTLGTLPLLETTARRCSCAFPARPSPPLSSAPATSASIAPRKCPARPRRSIPRPCSMKSFRPSPISKTPGAPLQTRTLIAGFGPREEVFRRALAAELKCPVATLSESDKALGLESSAKDLIHQDLDALVGWMLNGGS